jgi:hypothetical protein
MYFVYYSPIYKDVIFYIQKHFSRYYIHSKLYPISNMKKFLLSLIIIVSYSSIEVFAQTNVFPASGNVGIGTTTPDVNSILHIKGVHANTNALFELPAASNGNNTGRIVLKAWASEPDISWEGTGIGANINNWGLARYNSALSSSYIRFVPHPTVGYMLFSTITGSGVKHDNVMAIVNNMVGIGTTNPSRKFEVISETNNIAYFRDNSTASEVAFRGNSVNTIFDFGNRPLQVQFNSVPSFTLNTLGNMGIGTTNPTEKLDVNGNLQLSGTIKYGNAGVRTEYRNNAGLQGAGALSGFYEAYTPENFPKDASSWWHLIDSHHSNLSNNYAMQIAGSFFDQKLYFRKTNNNPAEAWKEFVAVDATGRINLDNDVAGLKKPVTIGGYVYGGAIRFNANSAVANNRNLELGNWDNSGVFYPRMSVSSENGNVGIGTTTPETNSILHINGGHGNTGTLLQLPASANANNTGDIFLKTWVSEPLISWEGTGIGANINNVGLKRFNNSMSSAYIRFVPNPTSGFILFSTIAGNGTKHDNVMAIVDDKVGIGTSTPTSKLDINGNGKFDDGIVIRNKTNIGAAGAKLDFTSYGDDSLGPQIRSSLEFAQGSASRSSLILSSYWGEYKNELILKAGNVGIGTSDTKGYKLAVAGDVIAERVVVKLQANWPDYVFKTGYSLRPLSEVEAFVKTNNHLPDVPSEAEIKEKGIDMEQMNATLLKKVEELTLYLIEQQKEVKTLREEVKQLKDKK